MLDKSLPFADLYMRLPKEKLLLLPEPQLPQGFSIAPYAPLWEEAWARVAASVLEFSNEEAALAYFGREFLPKRELLPQRMRFIVDAQGKPAATATAWLDDCGRNWLHWVAVRPDCQGLGLGRAVVLCALSRFAALGCADDVYLHTQTWSHVAIGLYAKLGFYPLKADPATGRDAGLSKTLDILSLRMPPDRLQNLRDSAE